MNDNLEECEAGIAGGCGACKKCDPAFWLKKAEERISELESKLAAAKERLTKLDELEAAGVDNWDGYDGMMP